MTDRDKALELWSLVVDEPFGLKVRVDDIEAAERWLYRTRNESKDQRLWGFWLSRRGAELWILRRQNVPEVRTDGAYRPLEE